ncbi:Phage tail repeat like [uncultured Caudovirales phage]|uniref:Phage tail repeat like n=1 Tax=uncultured Caudovirales phage TaxID=2100421 RepID=A0A6J5P245_9CAUD|nr:Phage tail repeat like [uncultured Caudovirales phage]CAB4163255.1 Phage tail repeat like [uncultured Caudovirales phage]CAB4191518.1 Phage tail repeat like [uncultured Caudovirales phage]
MSNQPPNYDRQFNFENYQSLNPSAPLPANQLESELNAASTSVNQTISRLNELQNADGSLKVPAALAVETTAVATSVATSVANSATQAYLSANYDPNVAIDAAASAAAALASKNAAQNAEFLALTHANYAEQATLAAQTQASQASTSRAQAQTHASAANVSKLETAALAAAVSTDYDEVAAVYAATLSLKNWVDSESFQFLHKREDMSDAGAIMLFNDGEAENTLIGKVFQGASVSADSSVVYRPPTSGTSVGNMDIYSGPWWVEGHDSPEDPHKIVMRDMMSCLVDTWMTFGPRVGPWSGGVGNIKPRQNGINGQPNASAHIGPERIKGVNYSQDNFGVGLYKGSEPLTPKGYVDASDTLLSGRIDGKANTVHTHVISSITGLQTALDGKSDTSHLHTGVYAPLAHSHNIADVTGLQDAINAARIQEYDNYKIYGVGDIVLQSNKIYRFNAGIGAAGYGPSTHPYAWTEQSAQPNLSGYATESFVNSKPGLINLEYSLNYTDIGLSSYTDTPVGVTDGQIGYVTYNLTITSPQDPTVSSYAGWTVSFVAVAGSSAMSTDVQSRTVTFDVNTMASNAQDVFNTLNQTHGWLGWSFGGALTTAYYVQPTEIAGKSFVLQGSTQQIQSNDKFVNAKGLWSDFSNSLNDLGFGNKLIGTDNYGRTKFHSTLDFAKEGEVAKISGTTFTGKVNTKAPDSYNASINIGSINSTANLTNSVAGDVWIGTWQMAYKTANGTLVYGAATNASNVFGSPQVIDTTSNTLPALRVTQKGTQPSLVVEDSLNPDTTALVVDTAGNVGIGVAAGYTSTSKLEVVGNVKATTLSTGTGPAFKINGTQAHSGGSDTHELLMSINGSTYRIGMRFVSTP